MSQTDPRLGLPSASKLALLIDCPGQDQLYRSIIAKSGPIAEAPDAAANFGTAVHLARQNMDPSSLTDEEREKYDLGLKFEEQIVAQWCRDNNITEYREAQREERIFIHSRETMEPVASAQLDVQYEALPHVLIIDWKSLGGWHSPPAPRNWQGRLQAIAKWRDIDGITKIRFALNRCAPKVGANDWCDYYPEDLEHSEYLIHRQLWYSAQPDAPRYPGPSCYYCPCKSYCDRAAAYSMLPGVIAQRAAPDTRKIDEQVGMLADADLFRIWDASGIVARVIDAVDARLKTFSKERLAELGLELPEQGSRNDKIANAKGAFEYLQTVQQMDPEKLWGLMQMNLGELRKMIQESKMLTDKGAKGWVEEFLREYMLFDHKAPSLRKLKIK